MRARVDCSSWDWSRDIATQRVQQTSHWGGGRQKGCLLPLPQYVLPQKAKARQNEDRSCRGCPNHRTELRPCQKPQYVVLVHSSRPSPLTFG